MLYQGGRAVGTSGFTPPEWKKNNSGHAELPPRKGCDYRVGDVWALGVCVFRWLLSDLTSAFIELCMKPLDARPDIGDVLRTPFLTGTDPDLADFLSEAEAILAPVKSLEARNVKKLLQWRSNELQVTSQASDALIRPENACLALIESDAYSFTGFWPASLEGRSFSFTAMIRNANVFPECRRASARFGFRFRDGRNRVGKDLLSAHFARSGVYKVSIRMSEQSHWLHFELFVGFGDQVDRAEFTVQKDAKNPLFCSPLVMIENTECLVSLDSGLEDLLRTNSDVVTSTAMAMKSDRAAVVVMGAPGTGKREWIQSYVEKNVEKDFVVLSRKSVEARLQHVEASKLLRGRTSLSSLVIFKELLRIYCLRGVNLIVEQVNLNERRRESIKLLEEHHYKILGILMLEPQTRRRLATDQERIMIRENTFIVDFPTDSAFEKVLVYRSTLDPEHPHEVTLDEARIELLPQEAKEWDQGGMLFDDGMFLMCSESVAVKGFHVKDPVLRKWRVREVDAIVSEIEEAEEVMKVLAKKECPFILSYNMDTTHKLNKMYPGSRIVVMERAECSLFDLLTAKQFDAGHIGALVQHMTIALNFLHKEANRFHFDVQPKSVYFFEGNFKLGRLGSNSCSVACRNSLYRSLDALERPGKYSRADDFWSLGVIVLESLLGTFPLPDDQVSLTRFLKERKNILDWFKGRIGEGHDLYSNYVSVFLLIDGDQREEQLQVLFNEGIVDIS